MKSDYQFEIISRIKKIREEKGVSQARMASSLGISLGQIGNIESYNMPHKYTLKQLDLICNNLGISMEDIFTSDDGKRPMTIEMLIAYLIKYQE